jgi:branched-subunit amino acid aminotransferase/4-amino-4-deoxychorismate lyase
MVDDWQPDRARGVFETLLVVDGSPVEQDAHLRRLTASLRILYLERLPAQAPDLLRRACRGIELGRVRLTVAPGAQRLTCEAYAEPIDPGLHLPRWEKGAELRCRRLPGGLGAHKWADRSWLPDGSDQALLLDANGDVLEAGWANAFSISAGVMSTPPLDGRILPGISRAVAIEIATEAGITVEQRHLGREELLGADEVFLTSSVRGIQPVRSLDGTKIARGSIAPLLCERLAGRYRTSRTLPAALSSSA